MHPFRLALLVVALLGLLACLGRPWLRLAFLERQVRRNFPEVRQLSGEDLERRLAAGEKIVLLDVRRPEEFAVSHLEGAVSLDPDAKEPRPQGVDRDAKIVVYCSVGWRSSQMARRLTVAGYRDVANLEGSIFRWAREGRPLVQGDGRRVTKVHPYGKAWEFLVPRERRAYRPEDAGPD